MTRAFIALGSNLHEPLAQVTHAVEEINALGHTQVIASSPWYQSEPTGPGDQANYINGVVEIETALEARALLVELQSIEHLHHRQRQERWGPRTLDLDIVLFGEAIIKTAALSIPHPRLHERDFVLQPLHDLAADLILPSGTPLASLLACCPRGGLQKLDGKQTKAAGGSSEPG